MNTFLEMQTQLQSDLNVSTASSLFPTATIKSALNRAYITVGGLFRWPALEDSLTTSTGVNQEYYDAPDTWRTDSIWKVEVDNLPYGEDPDGSPLAFEDYLLWRRDPLNSTSTEKKWAKQWMRYFIYPVPTTAGSNNISIWGSKNVETLTADGDTTIFSYNMPECNEALVMEAAAILKDKGENEKSGQLKSQKATVLLSLAYNKVRQESAKSEKNMPFFEVPDYYRTRTTRRSGTNIGNFNR
jgi:hypothetical protein